MAVGTPTELQLLPWLATEDWPPQAETQVFWLALHHACLSSWGTEPGSTLQHGMGVL